MNPSTPHYHGWLGLDKPYGISSAKAVAIVKRLTKSSKIGHGGTLDPLATGILPICLGEATKTSAYIMGSRKIYRFTMTFGEQRDTDDAEGIVIATSDYVPNQQELEDNIPHFTGDIMQTPPIYSALKQQGKRACDMVRAGVMPEMTPRMVSIYAMRLLSLHGNEATWEVECGKGTYIRSLARDIAEKVGSRAYVSMLRRLSVGKISTDKAILLDNLEEIVHNDGLSEYIWPITTVLDDIPAVVVTDIEAARIRHWQRLVAPPDMVKAPVVKILCQEQLVALAGCEDHLIRPIRVFNN